MSSSDLVFGNITVELRPLLYPKEVQNSCFLRRGEKMPSCFISIGSGFRQFFSSGYTLLFHSKQNLRFFYSFPDVISNLECENRE